MYKSTGSTYESTGRSRLISSKILSLYSSKFMSPDSITRTIFKAHTTRAKT